MTTEQATKAPELTLTQLRDALQAKMREQDVDSVIALSAQIQKLTAAEEKQKAAAVREKAQAEHNQKMAKLTPITDGVRAAIAKVLGVEVRKACTEAGIDRLVLDLGSLVPEAGEDGKVKAITVGLKAFGSGVPGAAPRASAGAATVNGRGVTVVWVTSDGRELSSREVFDEFGPDFYGDKFAEINPKTASWRVNEQMSAKLGLTRKA